MEENKQTLYNWIRDPISHRLYKFPVGCNYNITQVLAVIPNLGLGISLAINLRTSLETLS